MRKCSSFILIFTEAINLAADFWGISCLRYEIRDIQLPAKVTEAMQRQVGMRVGLNGIDEWEWHFSVHALEVML